MKLYADGAGWNGKTSGFAVVNENNDLIIKKVFREENTNNEMEYAAVLYALEFASSPGDEILTDSQLVVGQVTKDWKVKAQHLLPFVLKAKKLVAEKKIKLTWVPREENLAGIFLESIK